MNRSRQAILLVFILLFSLIMPFAIPSATIPEDIRASLEEELWSDAESFGGARLLNALFPSAVAEEALTPLPMDFSSGRKPDPSRFSADGYEDESINVKLEIQENNGVVWRIAYVTIQDASQLRTAMAGSLRSNRVALISSMAEKNNAVIAINADYLSNNPAKTSFEYRMGEKVRAKFNPTKDLLVTDENGDFHIFTAKRQKDGVARLQKDGHRIINAFTFGPALVIDEELQTIPQKYGYNPHGREPRMAIGQMDKLSYVLVLAEGRTEDSQGVTQQELADFMFGLGCSQAFNFDGGNSATMVFNGGYFQDKSRENERAQSDMLYFATLVGKESKE